MAGLPLPPDATPTTSVDMSAVAEWLRAAVRGYFDTMYDAEVAAARGIDHMEVTAAAEKLLNDTKTMVWDEVDKTFAQIRAALPDFPFAVVAWVLTEILGLTISADQIKTLTTGSPTDADRIALGRTLTTLYRETLPTTDVAAGFLAREPGTAEFTNFERLSGAAMRLQMADMVLDWLGRKIPFGLGDVLQDLADLFNDAIALDDALEEVVQVPMQAVIQRGMEAKYNRDILPVDFTNIEAMQAHIGYDLPRDTVNKILDNSGVRKDIRDTLLSMAATNLTESDINEAYQRNLLSIEQVKEQYKQKYFQEPERQIKTDLVKGTRRWQLQTKVVELLGNLYRDGVRTKDACIPYLNHLGFENDEQDLWFLQQDLEREQRKWITDNQLLKLLDSGQVTMTFAHDYLVTQGMVSNDAWILIGNHLKEEAVAKIPKEVRNKCLDILDPSKVLVQVLGELASLASFGTIFDSKMQELFRCLIEELGKATSTP